MAAIRVAYRMPSVGLVAGEASTVCSGAMKPLVDLAYLPRGQWADAARPAFYAALAERFPNVRDLLDKRNDERRFQLRVNGDAKEGAVPYAALIAPDQDLSGGYGGMSFVMFPSEGPDCPALVAMVVGTNGLAPDEGVLGRPGHARKCAAIASWLNQRQAGCAWAKPDPVRIDLDLPRATRALLTEWSGAVEKYGRVIYAAFVPAKSRSDESDDILRDALVAFIDLFFDERRIAPKKPSQDDAERIRRAWMSRIFPSADATTIPRLLAQRRFVIVEGPPGTGKTEFATQLLRDEYRGRGKVIQFHPGTTYESFVGGLAPREGGAMGFTFHPTPGHLMEAAIEAAKEPEHPYLLVIDEINRADLAKVLGEAIYLFEPGRSDRSVALQHPFRELPSARSFRLPPNLHVLGTMNTADRSIAILDIAVRRRFAFVPMWPQLAVVEAHSGAMLRQAFHEILSIFIEHASPDSLPLTPGHAYFLGDDTHASDRLATTVRPLLEEYLAQGYVSGFADEIRAYVDRIAQAG